MTDKLDELILEINKTHLPKETKQLLIDKGKELKRVRTLNNPTFSITDTYGYKPNKVAKYDIISILSGGIPHPGIIWKVTDTAVHALSFTSNSNYIGNIGEVLKSRFITNSFITCTSVIMSHSDALLYFKGIFDNKAEADRFFRLYKEYQLNLLGVKIPKKKVKTSNK